MANIFNLFLFLLLLWSILMFFSGNISWLYLFFGICFSAIISAASFRLKLIKKESELLYLSVGFYRHFLEIYFKNFIKSLKLILFLALTKKAVRPLVYSLKIDSNNKFNQGLMVATINIFAGIFCIKNDKDFFKIHAIDEKYFNDFNMLKMKKILPEINDDNLV